MAQQWPPAEPSPQFPAWCYTLGSEPTTRVAGANSWVDDFQTNVPMGHLNTGDMGYNVFDGLTSGGTNPAQVHSQHFVNNNDWIVDMQKNNGGAALSPSNSFRFQNGKLVLEADVAAGQPGFRESNGADIVWPEVAWSTAPAPTNHVVDGLYLYGQFGGATAAGCRLQAHRGFTCAVEADHTLSSVTHDQPPCFSTDPSRVMEISGFQVCGSTHSGFALDFGSPQPSWRTCQVNQTYDLCLDRFRFEWSQSGMVAYVNGVKFAEDSNWPGYAQLPANIVNGSTPVHAYFGQWGDFSDSNIYRFFWQRLAVNPQDASGNFLPPSASPTFCAGMPNDTCVDGSPTPTPASTPTPTPTPTATATATPTPTPHPTATPTPTPRPTPTPAPTPTPTPNGGTPLGYNAVGAQTDTSDSDYLNGIRVTTGASPQRIRSISVHVDRVGAAPNNKFQVGVYADANGVPGSLITHSATGRLTGNSWNTLAVSASLNANTSYWLMYNTNGSDGSLNNLHFDDSSSVGYAWSANSVTFGTWPVTFGPAVSQTAAFSIVAR